MFPPFSETCAFEICQEIIKSLNENKIILKQISKESPERKNQGIMIGVALCTFKNKQKILYTVSGISKILIEKKDSPLKNLDRKFVPPIVSPRKINFALFKNDKKIHKLTKKINSLKSKRFQNEISKEEQILREKRTVLCSQSLKKVYSLYNFYCFNGTKKNLLSICKKNLPPTGTGDCCEPKLINYANKKSYKIVSMCEVFYDKNTDFKNLQKIEPCENRCKLILPEMLGLEIVYRDENIIVVNKQSSVLSVPGRTKEKKDSIATRVKNLFPSCIEQPSVHRLDMETSGLMVLAFDKESHKNLNKQFENRLVQKEYIALLDGIVKKSDYEKNDFIKWKDEKSGIMELFFRLDIENRPHQIWDSQNGKSAITEFEILNYENYKNPLGQKIKATRIKFIPHTGRTHQLRLASADFHGFGHQIIGDTLYGKCLPQERLLLHAQFLSFFHPVTNQKMTFFLPPEF